MINRGFAKENIIMCDKSSYGAFWKSIGDSSFDINKFITYINSIPTDISKIQSYLVELSKKPADIDEEYVYLLLQAGAFGGKQIWNTNNIWRNATFRSYWTPTKTSSRRSPVNPMMPMPAELLNRVKAINNACKGIKCVNADISTVIPLIPKDNCIIYIDPPYANTCKYGFSFDYIDFLHKLLNITDSPIFISEKEQISTNAILLDFEGSKGGISGNKSNKNTQEWLNCFQLSTNINEQIIIKKKPTKKLF